MGGAYLLWENFQSFVPLQEKIDYGALIQELGGEYIDQDYFTPKCTHLVVGELNHIAFTL